MRSPADAPAGRTIVTAPQSSGASPPAQPSSAPRPLPVPVAPGEQAYASPRVTPLGPDAPELGDLFVFMREAESRFETLRMRATETIYNAAGQTRATIEVALRHPGFVKVVTQHGDDPLRREYEVWVSDGQVVRTFDARSNRASVRPLRARLLGATDPHLPAFSRVYESRTRLPMESLPETFLHPHGFCRNVLATSDVRLLGATRLTGGREALLLRALHPRTTQVLTDRPDHWLEVGVDRMLGIILLLVEGIGERVTRHAEVTELALDEPVGDDVFRLYISPDVRTIY